MARGAALHWAGMPHGRRLWTGRNMWGIDDCNRPSKRLEDLLTGRVTPQAADPQILPWAEFIIWKTACDVCRMKHKEHRQRALTKLPDTIRPFVEREVKRLWPIRNNL